METIADVGKNVVSSVIFTGTWTTTPLLVVLEKHRFMTQHQLTLTSTGNVTVTAQAGTGVGFFLLKSQLIIDGATTAFGGADTTPDVSGKTFFTTGGADTYLGFDVGGGVPDVGAIVIVLSAHAAVFDTTASGAAYPFVGSSVDITTASGDITMWIFDGTSFGLIQFTDISADNSSGI